MKKIIIVPIVLLALVGIFVWGYSTKGGTAASVQGVQTGKNSESPLVALEKFYDFGTISMKNGKVTKEFTVTNTSANDVTMKKVVTSCMCTNAFLVSPDGSVKGPFGMEGHGGFVPPVSDVIKAGESRMVRVVFDPNAHGPAGVGMIDRFIALTDANGGMMQLEIKANVTP